MEIILIPYKVFWQFRLNNDYKVTKCKKVINSKTNKILIQRIKGGKVGFYIGKKFIKREELNNYVEKIPIIDTPF